jgi:septal ring factor EnvC (AmiA/AmiB activator)
MAKTRTIAHLRKELGAKEKELQRLQATRKKLASQVGKLDREIAALCGKPAVRKVRTKRVKRAIKRTKGGRSLGDVLAQVLKGKGSVRVGDAAKMALGAGYKTTSKQFGNIVSQILATDDRFRRVRRGLFRLK